MTIPFDIQVLGRRASDVGRYRDMKLHSLLLGRSDPDQALRVAAGILRKRVFIRTSLPRASDGHRYCDTRLLVGAKLVYICKDSA